MQNYSVDQFKKLITDCKKPYVVLLVGLPLSGKDTFLAQLNSNDFLIISRDEILEKHNDKISDYRSAFSKIDSKIVDKQFFSKINEHVFSKINCIINATNLTKKRRRKICLRFTDYYRIALIMPLISESEFNRRNVVRYEKIGKKLPNSLYNEMTAVYEEVTEDEEFEKISYLMQQQQNSQIKDVVL
jgi:predicted kinase